MEQRQNKFFNPRNQFDEILASEAYVDTQDKVLEGKIDSVNSSLSNRATINVITIVGFNDIYDYLTDRIEKIKRGETLQTPEEFKVELGQTIYLLPGKDDADKHEEYICRDRETINWLEEHPSPPPMVRLGAFDSNMAREATETDTGYGSVKLIRNLYGHHVDWDNFYEKDHADKPKDVPVKGQAVAPCALEAFFKADEEIRNDFADEDKRIRLEFEEADAVVRSEFENADTEINNRIDAIITELGGQIGDIADELDGSRIDMIEEVNETQNTEIKNIKKIIGMGDCCCSDGCDSCSCSDDCECHDIEKLNGCSIICKIANMDEQINTNSENDIIQEERLELIENVIGIESGEEPDIKDGSILTQLDTIKSGLAEAEGNINSNSIRIQDLEATIGDKETETADKETVWNNLYKVEEEIEVINKDINGIQGSIDGIQGTIGDIQEEIGKKDSSEINEDTVWSYLRLLKGETGTNTQDIENLEDNIGDKDSDSKSNNNLWSYCRWNDNNIKDLQSDTNSLSTSLGTNIDSNDQKTAWSYITDFTKSLGTNIDPNDQKTAWSYIADFDKDIEVIKNEIGTKNDNPEQSETIWAEILKTQGRATTLEERATSVEGRATELEGRTTNVEDRATALEERAAAIEGEVTALEERATNVEGEVTALEAMVGTPEDAANSGTVWEHINALEFNYTKHVVVALSIKADSSGEPTRIPYVSILSQIFNDTATHEDWAIIVNSVSLKDHEYPGKTEEDTYYEQAYPTIEYYSPGSYNGDPTDRREIRIYFNDADSVDHEALISLTIYNRARQTAKIQL